MSRLLQGTEPVNVCTTLCFFWPGDAGIAPGNRQQKDKRRGNCLQCFGPAKRLLASNIGFAVKAVLLTQVISRRLQMEPCQQSHISFLPLKRAPVKAKSALYLTAPVCCSDPPGLCPSRYDLPHYGSRRKLISPSGLYDEYGDVVVDDDGCYYYSPQESDGEVTMSWQQHSQPLHSSHVPKSNHYLGVNLWQHFCALCGQRNICRLFVEAKIPHAYVNSLHYVTVIVIFC